MKVLFLIPVFFLMIITVHAQRPYTDYECEASYKNDHKVFDIKLDTPQEIELAGWKLEAAVTGVIHGVQVSLSRKLLYMNNSFHKTARRDYSASARTLPVSLIHGLAGKTEVISMTCFPKDDGNKGNF